MIHLRPFTFVLFFLLLFKAISAISTSPKSSNGGKAAQVGGDFSSATLNLKNSETVRSNASNKKFTAPKNTGSKITFFTKQGAKEKNDKNKLGLNSAFDPEKYAEAVGGAKPKKPPSPPQPPQNAIGRFCARVKELIRKFGERWSKFWNAFLGDAAQRPGGTFLRANMFLGWKGAFLWIPRLAH